LARGDNPNQNMAQENNGDGACSRAGEGVAVPALGTDGIRPVDGQPPAQFRLAFVSCLSAAIGLVAGVIAYALYT
jgi:hypothetical protein